MRSKKHGISTTNLNQIDALFVRALTLCELIDARADVLAFLYSAKPGNFYRALPSDMNEINRIAEQEGANIRIRRVSGFFRMPRSKKFNSELAYYIENVSGVKIDALKYTSRRFRK